MQRINLIQGTKEWHAHRANHYNASDAPAMMGESEYTSRDQLLNNIKYGAPEVSEQQQYLFDQGHKAEAKARPIAQKIIGELIMPTVGNEIIADLPMSASFDGINMLGTKIFEHKLINKKLRACDSADDLPMQYKIQMEHQLMVSGAEACLFMASDGTEDDMVHFWYKPDLALRQDIVDGWKQFDIDLKNYEASPVEKVAKAEPVEMLPALSVSVTGQITASNVSDVQASVSNFLATINRDLQTDDDFATAELVVKRCKEAEEQARVAKKSAVDQMADVSKVFLAIDGIIEQFRETRLELDKLVKSEKERRKAEMINKAKEAILDYVGDVNSELGGNFIQVETEFALALKGKRSIENMKSALNQAIANHKIDINQEKERIVSNMVLMESVADENLNLFPDKEIILKEPATILKDIIDSRILRYQEDMRRLEESKPIATSEPEAPQATIEPEPIAEPIKQEKDDKTLLKEWLFAIQMAAMNKPELADSGLQRFAFIRMNRIMAAVEEIKTKAEIE